MLALITFSSVVIHEFIDSGRIVDVAGGVWTELCTVMEFGTTGKEPVLADGAESDVVFFRLDDALDGAVGAFMNEHRDETEGRCMEMRDVGVAAVNT